MCLILQLTERNFEFWILNTRYTPHEPSFNNQKVKVACFHCVVTSIVQDDKRGETSMWMKLGDWNQDVLEMSQRSYWTSYTDQHYAVMQFQVLLITVLHKLSHLYRTSASWRFDSEPPGDMRTAFVHSCFTCIDRTRCNDSCWEFFNWIPTTLTLIERPASNDK